MFGGKDWQEDCESCRKIRNRPTAADVRYGNSFSPVCVNCVLTKHYLQGKGGDVKTKIKVLEILWPCEKCQDLASDLPVRSLHFCRECQHHICDKCKETDSHSYKGHQVGWKYMVSYLVMLALYPLYYDNALNCHTQTHASILRWSNKEHLQSNK